MALEPQSKFTNVSGGVAGAIKLNHKGEPHGVALSPGESIWLTEQEEVLTANAPRNPEDNPFTNGTYRLDVKAADAAEARPIGSRQEVQPPPPEQPPEAGEGDPEGIDLRTETTGPNEPPKQPAPDTGQPPAPTGEPVSGQRQPTEEAAVVEETAAAPTPADPAADEPAVPPEPPKPAAAPAPKPGQSKRAARVETPAAPKPVAAPAPAPTPAPAPAPTPAE